MIRFFRHIRQSLILPGSARKYLLYAFGEIFLVVFGILIALQLDDWYSKVKEDRVTQEYVQRLIYDLKSDTTEFSNYAGRSYNHNRISKSVYQLYKGDEQAFVDKTEALIAIQMVGRSWIPSVQTNTYQDLISTGNIRLIKDKNVSDKILEYYSNTYEDWFTEYKSRLWSGYLPLAIDLLDLNFLEDIMISEHNDSTITLPEHFELSVPEARADQLIKDFQNTPDFDFHIRNVARTHLLNAHVLTDIYKDAASLLHDLEAYQDKTYGGS